MELEKLINELKDIFRKNVISLRNHYMEIYQPFFTTYKEEILKLKMILIKDSASNIPTDFWRLLNNHFDYLRTQILSLKEKQNQSLDQHVWQEWKSESNSLLNEIPDKYSTSFSLEKFVISENDTFRLRQTKKYSIQYYRLKNLLSGVFRRKKDYLTSGRKIFLHNFIQYYLQKPGANFLYNSWHSNLKMHVQTLDLMQKITEQLKDNLLHVENLSENNNYWRVVMNPALDEITANYEKSVQKAEEFNEVFYQSMLEEFHAFVEDIWHKSEESLTVAGTSLLPNSQYRQRKINFGWRSLERKYRRKKKSWQIHLQTLQDEWLKDIDLAQLQFAAALYWHQTGQIIRNKFYNDIVPLFNELIKEISKTKKSIQINIENDEDKSELKNRLLLVNRKLIGTIRDKHLPDILNRLDPDSFAQTFSGFVKRMRSDVEALPEEHNILAFVDMERLPSKTKSDRVALKDILLGEAFYSAESRTENINNTLRDELDAASRSLARMDQVLEYNLEGALNLIREDQNEQSWQEAIKITEQGLERVEQNIEELITTLTEKIDAGLTIFDQLAADLEENIRILGDNEQLIRLKIRLTRARTKARILDLRKLIWQYLRFLMPKLFDLLQKSLKSINERYSKVQRLAGLADSDILTEIYLTQYLADIENKISQMPYTYQRIFRTEPLEDDKFFVGRSEVLAEIVQDFEDFKNNYHPITALVGEKGSGKTSTLNYARRNIFKGYAITEINITNTIHSGSGLIELFKTTLNLPEAKTIQDIIHTLSKLQERRICIIENIHNLFLRTIDGFQALYDLYLLLAKTRQNVFWIITCGRYAWEYLETVTKISSFFKRVIHLGDLTKEELLVMILNRHQISGYGINFIPPAKIAESRQYKKLNSSLHQQQYLEEYFFKKLSESAEGNIRVAIYFWLSAISEFLESSINLEIDTKFESQLLHQLPSDEIFSLAAFIQHEFLNEEQHAAIFNQTLTDSSILIEKLHKKGLLIRDKHDFLIHPFLYRPVIRALKRRNIV